jgi:DNA polymerase I-like protein with 3'-5' exonuclease and polymerase domains
VKWSDDAFMAFDFETSGALPEFALQPWRVAQGKAWATSLAWVYRQGGQTVVKGGPYPTKALMKEMLDQALDERRVLIGWHTVFDLAWLLAYGLEDEVMQCRYLDGMLLWRHLDIEPEYEAKGPSRRSYGLKAAVREFLPRYANYEAGIDFHSNDPNDRQKLHDYNIQDTFFTLSITKKLISRLKPRQTTAAVVEAQCLPLVASANLRGMLIDQIEANHLAAKLTQTAADMLAKLAPHGVSEKVVRSPAQLATLMFDHWQLPVLKENTSKLTGKISRSTDKEVLHELSFQDPRAKDLRTYRESLNQREKFATAPVRAARYNEDGRAHPQAMVFSTYTGRITYSSKQGRNKNERPVGWAIHQEKREKEFRRILRAPPGYTLVEFDAKGQEYRWMALASGDPVMLKLCQDGEDPHAYMGAQIAHCGYRDLIKRYEAGEKKAKDQRDEGKVSNLSLQYRTSWKKLLVVARVQYNIPMLPAEAKFIRNTYLQTYQEVPNYWQRQTVQTMTLGYVETFAGRRVKVVGDWQGPWGWSMASTAINFRIQGTGADQKYLALMCIRDYLVKAEIHFYLDMHDGLYFLVPDERVSEAVPWIKDQLDNLPYGQVWGYVPTIPMPWDVKTGKSWGSLKE